MASEATKYLEGSFLGGLLRDEAVTDISYNGSGLYYVDNRFGRKKADIALTADEASSFIRQIANVTDKNFNLAYPVLDVSFGRYRLNAVHSSIGRTGERKTPSFSIRIASVSSRLEEDPSFMDEKAKNLLITLLKQRKSILIGGRTGVGKTELQKWLLGRLEPNTRVIVIDNVEELSLCDVRGLDMTTWLTDVSPKLSASDLIQNALRHHPDYLLVAEARGKEMNDALFAAGSGHPLIMTMHAQELGQMPSRVLRLAKMGDPNADEGILWEEIETLFPYYAYISKETGERGEIRRHLEAIGHLGKERRMEMLYERRKGR